jgi:hypothetical protein
MLTHKQIQKVARLMDQVGELRPGFVHDSDANLDGAVSACQAAVTSRRPRSHKRKATGRTSVRVRTVFETDSETGEVRAVQK